MFWVISTAFVLQGVIISLRGPTYVPDKEASLQASAPPKSHARRSFSEGLNEWSASTAKAAVSPSTKNVTIGRCCKIFRKITNYSTIRQILIDSHNSHNSHNATASPVCSWKRLTQFGMFTDLGLLYVWGELTNRVLSLGGVTQNISTMRSSSSLHSTTLYTSPKWRKIGSSRNHSA